MEAEVNHQHSIGLVIDKKLNNEALMNFFFAKGITKMLSKPVGGIEDLGRNLHLDVLADQSLHPTEQHRTLSP